MTGTGVMLHTAAEPVWPLDKYVEESLSREQMALVWVVKNEKTKGHRCYLPGARSLMDDQTYIDEGSVIQCLICASYWRLYALGSYGIPHWDQVVPMSDGSWRAVRSRLIKVRNVSDGGGPIWPWRVNA